MGLLGAHMSIAGSIALSIRRGELLGCEAIQIFTKNQLQWKAPPLFEEDVDNFKRQKRHSSIRKIIAHSSYLINLASPEKGKYVRSISSVVNELERADTLGISYVVLHPGAHMGKGEAFGLDRVVSGINVVLRETSGLSSGILLETTAGQGSNLGYTFQQIGYILQRVVSPERVGVCFDTCHVFAAGYDFSTEKGYYNVCDEFDRIIGMEKLKAIHLNDSVFPVGSRKDRHTHIGQGCIGLTAFSLLVNDLRFEDIPMILETPKDGDMDARNLALLKGFRKERSRSRAGLV